MCREQSRERAQSCSGAVGRQSREPPCTQKHLSPSEALCLELLSISKNHEEAARSIQQQLRDVRENIAPLLARSERVDLQCHENSTKVSRPSMTRGRGSSEVEPPRGSTAAGRRGARVHVRVPCVPAVSTLERCNSSDGEQDTVMDDARAHLHVTDESSVPSETPKANARQSQWAGVPNLHVTGEPSAPSETPTKTKARARPWSGLPNARPISGSLGVPSFTLVTTARNRVETTPIQVESRSSLSKQPEPRADDIESCVSARFSPNSEKRHVPQGLREESTPSPTVLPTSPLKTRASAAVTKDPVHDSVPGLADGVSPVSSLLQHPSSSRLETCLAFDVRHRSIVDTVVKQAEEFLSIMDDPTPSEETSVQHLGNHPSPKHHGAVMPVKACACKTKDQCQMDTNTTAESEEAPSLSYEMRTTLDTSAQPWNRDSTEVQRVPPETYPRDDDGHVGLEYRLAGNVAASHRRCRRDDCCQEGERNGHAGNVASAHWRRHRDDDSQEGERNDHCKVALGHQEPWCRADGRHVGERLDHAGIDDSGHQERCRRDDDGQVSERNHHIWNVASGNRETCRRDGGSQEGERNYHAGIDDSAHQETRRQVCERNLLPCFVASGHWERCRRDDDGQEGDRNYHTGSVAPGFWETRYREDDSEEHERNYRAAILDSGHQVTCRGDDDGQVSERNNHHSCYFASGHWERCGRDDDGHEGERHDHASNVDSGHQETCRLDDGGQVGERNHQAGNVDSGHCEARRRNDDAHQRNDHAGDVASGHLKCHRDDDSQEGERIDHAGSVDSDRRETCGQDDNLDDNDPESERHCHASSHGEMCRELCEQYYYVGDVDASNKDGTCLQEKFAPLHSRSASSDIRSVTLDKLLGTEPLHGTEVGAMDSVTVPEQLSGDPSTQCRAHQTSIPSDDVDGRLYALIAGQVQELLSAADEFLDRQCEFAMRAAPPPNETPAVPTSLAERQHDVCRKPAPTSPHQSIFSATDSCLDRGGTPLSQCSAWLPEIPPLEQGDEHRTCGRTPSADPWPSRLPTSPSLTPSRAGTRSEVARQLGRLDFNVDASVVSTCTGSWRASGQHPFGGIELPCEGGVHAERGRVDDSLSALNEAHSETVRAQASGLPLAQRVLATMSLATPHARSGRLTVRQLHAIFDGTCHEPFVQWLTVGKQWCAYADISGTIELRELRAALVDFCSEPQLQS